MTEPAKPLPCPFCGGDAKWIDSDDRVNGGMFCCTNQECFVEARSFDVADRDEALKIWNHRAVDPRVAALEQERDKLKAANARMVIAHIERICPVCCHMQDEDNQCANCLKAERDKARAMVSVARRSIELIRGHLREGDADGFTECDMILAYIDDIDKA